MITDSQVRNISLIKQRLRNCLATMNGASQKDQESKFYEYIGIRLRQRRIELGYTQTKVANKLRVTFQQIQKYEKGTNGVSSIRLLQLSNYLKVPINYFFEDFSEYLINLEKSKEGHMNVNYNFLIKLYTELNSDQKIKLLLKYQYLKTVKIY